MFRLTAGRVADEEGPLIPAAVVPVVVVEPVIGIGELPSAGGGTGDDVGDTSGVVGSRVAASPPVLDRTPRERGGGY